MLNPVKIAIVIKNTLKICLYRCSPKYFSNITSATIQIPIVLASDVIFLAIPAVKDCMGSFTGVTISNPNMKRTISALNFPIPTTPDQKKLFIPAEILATIPLPSFVISSKELSLYRS
ncbi:hypothetical protein IV70_GL003013 [Carnobacterium maltaromaticum DSM 20342]|nr:hypothetical protein IV70_GL003013 [Carnobacterium maltaromaticum DSM 20342]